VLEAAGSGRTGREAQAFLPVLHVTGPFREGTPAAHDAAPFVVEVQDGVYKIPGIRHSRSTFVLRTLKRTHAVEP
jgi:hypothetical protein